MTVIGVSVGGLIGTAPFHSSSLQLSRRAEGEALHIPDSALSGDAIWPTAPNSPGQWWVYTTVSVHDSSFWDKFRALIAKWKPGRVYAVLIQPTTLEGRTVTLLPSMNIATPLEPLIEACNARIAKLEEEYDGEFLGTTDIRFKDIAPIMPDPPASRKSPPSTSTLGDNGKMALYTSMYRPMPVGAPTLVPLTVQQFERGEFFGYLWAKVQAPSDLYVGLLPIKYQGRLICPAGTFGGFFFSEELRFALDNGYGCLVLNWPGSSNKVKTPFGTS